MPPKVTEAELALAVRLLKKNTSLHAVSAYLKRRELTSSATSWESMRDDRLKVALDAGDLDRTDLLQLLRASEEHGRQHVFLYRCSKTEAAELTNESSLRKRLATLDLLGLLDAPRIVEMVPGLQLVEAGIEQTSTGSYFVAKLVDVRRYKTQIGKETNARLRK
jgi:hypothetical protein